MKFFRISGEIHKNGTHRTTITMISLRIKWNCTSVNQMDFYRIYWNKLHNSTNQNRVARSSKSMCNIHTSWLCHLRLCIQWHGRVTVTQSINVQLGTTAELSLCHTSCFLFIPEAHVRAKTSTQANSAPCHYPKLSAPVLIMEHNDSADEVRLFLACKWGKKIKIPEWMNTFYFFAWTSILATWSGVTERCPEWCVLLQRMS